MFEWLEQEILQIKTPKFHLVEGPADEKLQQAVVQSRLQLPPSYKQFVLQFGNVKLYRRAKNSSYIISVFAGPREVALADGTIFYHVGFHDDANVYLKPTTRPGELSVFEFVSHSKEKVASNFEKWLRTSCARARKAYGKEKWEEIVSGPAPFTQEEQEILETRRRIHWQVIGIDAHGNHMIEVRNASSRTLPVLTVGARSTDARLNGAVLLQIEHIGLNESAVLHVDCYKDLIPPKEIELFALPEPGPEDRDAYAEFSNI